MFMKKYSPKTNNLTQFGPILTMHDDLKYIAKIVVGKWEILFEEGIVHQECENVE